MTQFWRDERLAYSNSSASNVTLTGDFVEKIWVPDTYFSNDMVSVLHDVTELNRMIRLYGDGSVVYGLRLARAPDARPRFFSGSRVESTERRRKKRRPRLVDKYRL